MNTDDRSTAHYRTRDIGYGVETGKVHLPALGGPYVDGKREYAPADGSERHVYLFDDELVDDDDADIEPAPADVWSLLEDAPEDVADVADLYHWSLNHEPGKGPFALFLDLIGWSDDVLGEPLYSLKDASLGYMELDKLGAALRQYTAQPHDVRDFVDALMSAEAGQ